MHPMIQVVPLVLTLTVLIVPGCGDSSDERLVRLSQESVERQAEQNRAMAAQGQAVADASKELVAADARCARSSPPCPVRSKPSGLASTGSARTSSKNAARLPAIDTVIRSSPPR